MSELLDFSKMDCCGSSKNCGDCLDNIKRLVDQKKLPPDVLTTLDQALCFACRDCEMHLRKVNCCVLPCIFIDAPTHDPDDIVSINTPTTLSVVICFGGPGAAALMAAGLDLTADWYAESIGPAPEWDFTAAVPGTRTRIRTVAGQFCYVLQTVIPGGIITVPAVYAFATMITLGANTLPLMDAWVAGGFVEFT